MNLVESTSESVATVPHQAKWIKFRNDRNCDSNRTFIFTDGSSNGGYSAVIVRGGIYQSRSGWNNPTSTRNVGAELNGMLLGLQALNVSESVTIVSDYIGIAAWMSGNWKIKDPEVKNKINEAKTMIRTLSLDVDYIHHAGHQSDTSEFTKWNSLADRLATIANDR